MPGLSVSADPRVVGLPFEPPLKIPGFDVVMASDRRSERELALRWLVQLVRSVL